MVADHIPKVTKSLETGEQTMADLLDLSTEGEGGDHYINMDASLTHPWASRWGTPSNWNRPIIVYNDGIYTNN